MSISEMIIKALGVILAIVGVGVILAALGTSIFGITVGTGFPAILAVVVGLCLLGIGIWIVRGGTITP